MAAIPPQLIGESPAFHTLMDQISDLASLDRPILIVGERGTGKELVGSRLHFLSPRWEQSFFKVNCAAFSEEQLDFELFGRTYADSRPDRSGRFEMANEGTLLLDNIETMPARMQEKLLRLLEYGEFQPDGAVDAETADVRVIAATSIDLPTAVDEGRFRADLLDRLAFEVLTLPPLRNRREDIPRLSEQFGKKMASSLGADSFPGFTPEITAFLMEQHWDGNIRALKNVVERSVTRAFLDDEALGNPISTISMDPFDGPWRLTGPDAERDARTEDIQSIPAEPVPAEMSELGPGTKHFAERVLFFERGLIDEALVTAKNHQGKAAEYLGLSYHQFRGLLRKHGLKK